ncbi:hypothetical protein METBISCDRAFT_28575 [Metschnikowia bicuspidata]|uniref:Arrestin-like N-terminal domain-containing protein n=1 Tax=Metschnikowia bicuspidata TaxID=27322 RepID=A0A4P9ZAF9_9ASCO|nr:hypothetical protein METBISCDRAFT_28575 [Metschnikowia bicuspidata]
MTVPKRSLKKRNETLLLADTHKVLYDTVMVFPPENILQVSLAEEFTLASGTNTYPFLFKIPMKTDCLKASKGSDLVLSNRNTWDVSVNYAELSLPAMSNCANIMYLVKVTCKKASLFKMSVRAIDPFTFLPLDLYEHFQPIELQEEGYRELFFRKDVVFRNRIPQIIPLEVDKPSYQRLSLPVRSSKKCFFSSLFFLSSPPPPPEKPRRTNLSCSSDSAKDVNFTFEIRFHHPMCLPPIGPPRFKLFFQSNRLETIFLQKLKIDLVFGTNITVVEKTGFPVSLSATSKGFIRPHTYELEISKKYYENVTFPPNLTPAFQPCNIERTYLLVVAVGVSSENLSNSMSRSSVYKRIKFVDLFCPNIRVLSGQKLPEALHSKAFNANLGSPNGNGKVHSGN